MEKDNPEHQHAPPPCIFVERTLALIKPDAVDKADEIEDIILLSGFTILQKRKLQLSPEQCSDFYAEHYGQPFFPSLTAFMSSGPVVALALARHRAIATWKDLMGPSNSTKARETHPDSLRARFGTSDLRNAVHGSETFSAAERELKFMFPNSNHAEGAIMQKIMQIQVKSLFTKCENLSDFDRVMVVVVVAVIEPIPKGKAATDYLSRYINPTLLIGLTELCKTKPADPFTWLADWLIQNNPNKPQISEGTVVEQN